MKQKPTKQNVRPQTYTQMCLAYLGASLFSGKACRLDVNARLLKAGPRWCSVMSYVLRLSDGLAKKQETSEQKARIRPGTR
ncbi:hypothetical protein RRG08_034196 [Elysia crispata]|uniref:Uncharacterized protein n=1 Tax=Elysia crispata TaxID=231223 RepID=A0AAE1DRF4_9GAST|nr:hypothetical protein RRG08_034196 [Elysia crispata]